jgi:hypothetical protein
MSVQPPVGNLFGDRVSGNRIENRVAEHTGEHYDVPADDEHVDDLVKADADERLEESPEEQKNFTDPDREKQAGE